MIGKIDLFLQNITMYRFVLYGLLILVGISFTFSLFSLLPFTLLQMVLSFVIISTVGFVCRIVGSFLYKVPSNTESSLITVLILFLTLSPVFSASDGVIVAVATGIAIFSKFFLSINKKHIFNPAAFGLFIIGLLGFGNATWWIGSAILLPFVAIFGLLVLRKMRKFQLFFIFLIFALIFIAGMNMHFQMSFVDSFTQVFISWPVVFFGTVMLTEPSTMPSRRIHCLLYAGLVGILFSVRFHLGPFYSSPEFSLIAGNIFSYIFSQRDKLVLRIQEVRNLAPSLYEIIFPKPTHFTFTPGEYMEWTLPHANQDSRGMRRYFSIISSPQDDDLKIAIKIPEKASSYKRAIVSGESIQMVAGQRAGDFILPSDTAIKMVFIAGGIGITPMISMIMDMVHTQTRRDIVLFYACVSKKEFIYDDILKSAEKYGVMTVRVITQKDDAWKGETGYITHSMIKKYVKDALNMRYYLSGPNKMVNAYKKLLHGAQIPLRQIVTDYFPGY